MSAFEKTPRPFKVVMNKATNSGVLKIQIGELELSITTLDGNNEAVVFSKSGDQIAERRFTDFNEVVSFFWKLEHIDSEWRHGQQKLFWYHVQYWLARYRYNTDSNLNSIQMLEVQEKNRRTFQLHDSETICKLFLNACRQLDAGKLTPEEFTQSCMRINDEAENYGLLDSLTDWESWALKKSS